MHLGIGRVLGEPAAVTRNRYRPAVRRPRPLRGAKGAAVPIPIDSRSGGDLINVRPRHPRPLR